MGTAEWEYACRAGTVGDYAGEFEGMGWYGANAGGAAHPVGQKRPNAWGLYDMHGKGWEWWQDWLDRDYYKKGVTVDPAGGPPGERRMIRGGCWFNEAEACRSAYRSYSSPGQAGPHLGFRVVRMVRAYAPQDRWRMVRAYRGVDLRTDDAAWQTLLTLASDHLPVMAELELRTG